MTNVRHHRAADPMPVGLPSMHRNGLQPRLSSSVLRDSSFAFHSAQIIRPFSAAATTNLASFGHEGLVLAFAQRLAQDEGFKMSYSSTGSRSILILKELGW